MNSILIFSCNGFVGKYLADEFRSFDLYAKLINVIKITNQGIHGTELENKYFDYVSKEYPLIVDGLKNCKKEAQMYNSKRKSFNSERE